MNKTETKYEMDQWTLDHMNGWLNRFAPIARECVDMARERMLTFIQSQSISDAEYLMGMGWERVYYQASIA